MKKAIFFFVFFLLVTTVFCNSLSEFFSYLNSEGSIKFDLEIDIHIEDMQNDSSEKTYIDENIEVSFAMSHWKNYYCEFKKPEFLENIAFVYLDDEEILFSLVDNEPWRQYRVNSNIDMVFNILNNIIWELFNENTYEKEEIISEETVSYIFTPNKAKSALNSFFSGGYLPDYMYFTFVLENENIPVIKELIISEKTGTEYIKLYFSEVEFSKENEYFEEMQKLYYDTFN